jgi:hypothetical protein
MGFDRLPAEYRGEILKELQPANKTVRGREFGELYREDFRPSEPEPEPESERIAGGIAGDLLDDGGRGGADGNVG